MFTVFGSFYCYNGLLRERQFELLGYAVAMSIIFIYVIINYCMEGVDEDYARLVRFVTEHLGWFINHLVTTCSLFVVKDVVSIN